MTPRAMQVLDYVRDQIEKTGTSPSIREIADHLGSKSTSSTFFMVRSLVEAGLLQQRQGVTRGLSLPGAPSLTAIPTRALEAELRRRAASRNQPLSGSPGTPAHDAGCNAPASGGA